jgi:hypothetical protein
VAGVTFDWQEAEVGTFLPRLAVSVTGRHLIAKRALKRNLLRSERYCVMAKVAFLIFLLFNLLKPSGNFTYPQV